MGTIGLSFGSPTSGQGIDVASTVTQMVTQLQATETPYKNQLTSLHSQDTVISNLGSLLSTLSNDITGLTDPAGVLSGKQGSSSDTNTLALLSADTTATAGSHTVTVQSLAQTSTEASSAVGANDILSGSFSFHIGSGSSQTVSVDPSNNTLAGLAATINQAGIGVSASVVTDSSGSRLSLISQTSGAAGQITIDSNSLSDATTGAVSLIAGQPARTLSSPSTASRPPAPATPSPAPSPASPCSCSENPPTTGPGPNRQRHLVGHHRALHHGQGLQRSRLRALRTGGQGRERQPGAALRFADHLAVAADALQRAHTRPPAPHSRPRPRSASRSTAMARSRSTLTSSPPRSTTTTPACRRSFKTPVASA